MRLVPTSLLAGVASVALAGTVAAHTLTVRLPDGATENITYSGNVAPQVALVPATAMPAPDWAFFGPNSPFAMMQQISAQMDREAAVMMRQMNQLQAIALRPMSPSGQPFEVNMTNLPRGAQSYSFISTLSPGGMCTQSMQITSAGLGQKPRVITHSSGNCGAMGITTPTAIAAPDEAPAAMPARPQAQTYQASAVGNIGDRTYDDLFRATSW